MGKIVHLNKKRKSSLLSTLVFGIPGEFSFFGKTVRVMGIPYLIKKRKEFFNDYMNKFFEGLCEINPSQEFDSSYVINNYNSLSPENRAKVLWDCSEIYAFNDKLNYADFIKVVDSYASKNSFDK